VWRSLIEELAAGRSLRIRLARGDRLLSYGEALEALAENVSFRGYFVDLLAELSYPAYFWETPPLTAATLGRCFEFVVTDSPTLFNMTPEPAAFSEHFERADDGIAGFPNLGGDALLLTPRPFGEPAHGVHLASFSRYAPVSLQHALWQRTAAAIDARLREEPVWVSTCGTGVGWLHIRLDQSPKYYSHPPYRTV
tara:strand:- start:265 stop:849 length:585 start_codon:yes stop_codon:yes gene_type:complete